MSPDNDGSGSAALSVDDAVARLNAIEDDTPAAAAPEAPAAAAPEPAAETPSEGAASAPEETSAEAETLPAEGEEGEAGEQAETPLEPPLYWKPEAKAKFATLDPELQAEILSQEGPREAAAAKAKDEAAQARATAEKETQGVQRFAEELGKFLPQAVQTFRGRWGDNPDWVAFAQQNGAEAMTVAKAQYEAERQQLLQVAEASKTAETMAHQAYVVEEFKTLQKIAPELADPKEGPARRTEITRYLVEAGIPPTAIRSISAVEMTMAHKAMLWDAARAKSAPNPAPKPAPAATRPLARGAASVGSADPKVKQAQTAKNRFVQTRSIDDAVALLNARDD